MQTWTEEEIKELIQYAQHLRKENEDLQAKMIMMNAKLGNEEAKTKQLKIVNYCSPVPSIARIIDKKEYSETY